jgi:hypothetical protein
MWKGYKMKISWSKLRYKAMQLLGGIEEKQKTLRIANLQADI